MLVPASHLDLLERPILGHLATIGADGGPEVAPVWFGWDGEVIKVSSLQTRQKVRNLQRNPGASLLVVDPDDDYRYIELRGRVVRMEEDLDHAYIDEMAKRYLRVDSYPWQRPGDRRVVLELRPERVRTLG
ncbi:MAG TPA: PPOX class F420-dependent oxidoreductase [Acidimicrobiia bacterium]